MNAPATPRVRQDDPTPEQLQRAFSQCRRGHWHEQTVEEALRNPLHAPWIKATARDLQRGGLPPLSHPPTHLPSAPVTPTPTHAAANKPSPRGASRRIGQWAAGAFDAKRAASNDKDDA